MTNLINNDQDVPTFESMIQTGVDPRSFSLFFTRFHNEIEESTGLKNGQMFEGNALPDVLDVVSDILSCGWNVMIVNSREPRNKSERKQYGNRVPLSQITIMVDGYRFQQR